MINNQFQRTLYWLVVITIFSTIVITTSVYSRNIVNGIYGFKNICFIFLISILTILVSQTITSYKKYLLFISLIDIFVIIILIYILIHLTLFDENTNANIVLYCLLSFYILLKQCSHYIKNFVHYISCAIIISSLVQVFLGIFQIFKLFPSFNNNFSVTGSFSNPGPYAGYISTTLPFLYVANSYKKGPVKYLMVFIICVSIALVIYCDSRASILAILATIIVKYNKPISDKAKKYLGWIRYPIILFLIISLSFFIYNYKLGSSNGRLLIWKVCALIIKNYPFFGIGIGNFNLEYNNIQSQYLYKSISDEKYLASNGEYTFNEFIGCIVYFGIPFGCLIIIFLTFLIREFIKTYQKNSKLKSFFESTISLLVFSFFSYPLSLIPFLIILFINISVISTNRCLFKFNFNVDSIKYYILSYQIVPIFFIIDTVSYYNYLWIWEKARIHSMLDNSIEANRSLETIYHKFSKNGHFLRDYGQSLVQAGIYNKGIYMLKRSSLYSSDVYTYVTLAEVYKAKKDYKSSEINLHKASCIMPSLFYPKYLLYKLYIESNQSHKAYKLKNEILHMRVKVRNSLTDDIISEMKSIK